MCCVDGGDDLRERSQSDERDDDALYKRNSWEITCKGYNIFFLPFSLPITIWNPSW